MSSQDITHCKAGHEADESNPLSLVQSDKQAENKQEPFVLSACRACVVSLSNQTNARSCRTKTSETKQEDDELAAALSGVKLEK